jgi:threonine aldolase
MVTNPLSRRAFLHSGTAFPLALALGVPLDHLSADGPSFGPTPQGQSFDELQRIVKLRGDGQSLTPLEYVHVLSQILSERGIEADYYSNGGVVEELERRMAQILGKERAVFLATGTLANHLALRIQAGSRTRVLVQEESHIFSDSGDGAQVLSNLNLIPIVTSDGTFTVGDVERAVRSAEGGRVRTGVGVISIESPIRRRLGKLFEYEAMKQVGEFARSEGIATHLDGARLFMASGTTGIRPEAYASHFDTVYVSMWKYFNASSGAILAGPRDLLDDLYHARRMFGGALPGAWPLAAVALHFLDGFTERFSAGVRAGKELMPELNTIRGLGVEGIPNGSNIVKLHLDAIDPIRFRQALAGRGIQLPAPNPNFRGFALVVNETLARQPVASLVRAFEEAARA